MKTILILAALVLGAVNAQAQEVTPVYAEGKTGKSIKGQFTVMNKGLTNLPVIVEPKQLQIVDGKATFGTLQPDAKLELKDTSAVIPPRGSRTFDYKLSCTKDCMVMLLSGMTTGKTKEGVMIRLWIPSSVYLCQEQKDCRVRTKKAAGLP